MTEGAVLYFIKISISDDTTTPVVDSKLHSTCSTAASTTMMGTTITVTHESTMTAFKTRFLVQTRPESERPCDRACEATTATDECKASDVFDTTGSHPRLLRQLR